MGIGRNMTKVTAIAMSAILVVSLSPTLPALAGDQVDEQAQASAAQQVVDQQGDQQVGDAADQAEPSDPNVSDDQQTSDQQVATVQDGAASDAATAVDSGDGAVQPTGDKATDDAADAADQGTANETDDNAVAGDGSAQGQDQQADGDVAADAAAATNDQQAADDADDAEDATADGSAQGDVSQAADDNATDDNAVDGDAADDDVVDGDQGAANATDDDAPDNDAAVAAQPQTGDAQDVDVTAAQAAIDNATQLADGEYAPVAFTATSNSVDQSRIDAGKVVVKDGHAFLQIAVQSGTYSNILAGGEDIAPLSDAPGRTYTQFELPLAIGQDMVIAATDDSLQQPIVLYTFHVDGVEPIADAAVQAADTSQQAAVQAQDQVTASPQRHTAVRMQLTALETGDDQELAEQVKKVDITVTEVSEGNVGMSLMEVDTAIVAPSGTYTVAKNIELGTHEGCVEVVSTGPNDMRMFRVVDCTVESDGSSMTATITLSGTGQTHLLMDADADEAAAAQDKAGSVDKIPGIIAGTKVVNSEGVDAYQFVIPVASLEQQIFLASYSASHDSWYSRCIVFHASNFSPAVDADELAAQNVIEGIDALPAADDVTVDDKADIEDARAAYDDLTDAQKKLVTNYELLQQAEEALEAIGNVAPSGTYSLIKNIELGTKQSCVEVVSTGPNDMRMFRVVDATIKSDGKTMTAVITLSGVGQDYLLMDADADTATAAQAKAGSVDKIPDVIAGTKVVNSEGVDAYQFEIPVAQLDEDILLASHSSSKDAWFSRDIIIHSSNFDPAIVDEEADDDDDPTNEEEESDDNGNGDNGNGSNNNGNGSNGNGSADNGNGSNGNGSADNGNGSNGNGNGEASGSGDANNGGSGYNEGSGTGGSVSSTTLPDGTYTPDSFSWSGGSGRLKGITCTQVRVSGGQAYATIVFASPNYDRVSVGGSVYYTTVSGSTSTVEIPVNINKNTVISAETLAMSAPHWVDYVIFVYVSAADSAGGESATGSGSVDSTTFDSDAPQILGLTVQGEQTVEHAEYFKIFSYDQGIKLIEVDVTKDTVRDPELAQGDAGSAAQSAEADAASTGTSGAITQDGDEGEADDSASEITQRAELYKGNVYKYLVVPEGVEVPAGMGKDVIVVQQPANKSYVASEESLSQMDQLSLFANIIALGYEAGDVPYDMLKQAMQNGSIAFAGAGYDPDFRALVTGQANLAIIGDDILPRDPDNTDDPDVQAWKDSLYSRVDGNADGELLTVEQQTQRLYDLGARFATLNVPMFVDRSSDEEQGLAQIEWIKVYGALYGVSDQAQAIYDIAVAAAGQQTTTDDAQQQ